MRTVAVAVVLILSFASITVGATAGQSQAVGVSTTQPITISGLFETETLADAIFIPGDDWIGITTLQAEAVSIEVTWQRGIEVGGSIPLMRQVVDSGRSQHTFTNVNLSFSAHLSAPMILAHGESQAIRMRGVFDEATRITFGQSRPLVGIGHSPDSIGGGSSDNKPNFWYSTPDQILEIQGSGLLQAHGSFLIFISDVWISAEGDEGSWSDWTGHQESDPDSALTEYELRVTTLRVTNGSLNSGSSDRLEIFSPRLDADLTGSLSTLGVTGQLTSGNERHLFNEDKLLMTGSGGVSMWVSTAGSPNGQLGAVSFDASDSFRVSGASIVEIGTAGSDPATTLGVITSLVLAGSTLAGIGLIALGIIPAPHRGTRAWQAGLWMERGYRSRSNNQWKRAARSFERAARLHRTDPLAWYEWAFSELEAGNHWKADEVAIKAAEVPGIDRLDILDIRVSAAWERDDQEAVREHLDALAAEAPTMAWKLINDLGITIDPHSQAGKCLRSGQPQGGIDGYA